MGTEQLLARAVCVCETGGTWKTCRKIRQQPTKQGVRGEGVCVLPWTTTVPFAKLETKDDVKEGIVPWEGDGEKFQISGAGAAGADKLISSLWVSSAA